MNIQDEFIKDELSEDELSEDDAIENNDTKIIKYKALTFLHNNYDDLDKYINIVAYKINNTEQEPYLSFMLIKENAYWDNLTFPVLSLSNISNVENSIKNLVYLYLNINSDILMFNENTVVKGCYNYKNERYIFIDITYIENNTDLLFKSNIVWFVLPDEIINKKHVCNIHINKNVTDFFLNNSHFLFLYDSYDTQLTPPCVVYNASLEQKAYFNFIFGSIKQESIFGRHYYFTNLQNAINESISNKDANSIKNKKCIIRYALFLGNCLYDTTDLTKENKRIDDILSNTNYDSIFFESDKLTNSLLYVVKDYNRQTSLSYHYIDNRQLTENFEENYNYNYKIQ